MDTVLILSLIVFALLASVVTVLYSDGRRPPKLLSQETQNLVQTSAIEPSLRSEIPATTFIQLLAREIGVVDAAIENLKALDPSGTKTLIISLRAIRAQKCVLKEKLERVPAMGRSFEEQGII